MSRRPLTVTEVRAQAQYRALEKTEHDDRFIGQHLLLAVTENA